MAERDQTGQNEAGDPLETELKLGVPPSAWQAVETHPALMPPRAAPAHDSRLISVYYDTPSRVLAAAGFGLRVRGSGGGFVQTLKSRGGSDGAMTARAEWEWTIAGPAPQPELLAGTGAAGLLGDAPLEPILHTDVQRSTRLLDLPGGTRVEAALDRGHIRAGGRSAAIDELELELKSGPPGPLYRLAVELHTDLALCLGAGSKAGRGQRLLTGAAPGHLKPAELCLPAEITVAAAFRAIVAHEIGAFTANQPAALAADAEGVHQMRIALRRLRAALVLFAPHLDPAAAAQFNAALRALGHVLGTARDWDVFAAETLPAAFDGTAEDGWRAMLDRGVAPLRQAAHAQLAAELNGPTPAGLVLSLAAWSHEPDLLRGAGQDTPLAALAPALLDRLARKVRRRSRHIASLDATELHDLRKSLKKLRYAADFVQSLYPEKPVRAYLKRCKRLQDVLGCLNDAAAAAALGGTLADTDIAFAAPLAHLSCWARERRRTARRRLANAAAALSDAAPFWD